MLKLMIVDDEYIVRSGIRKILPWTELNIVISGEAECVDEAIEVAHDMLPDIVLCDIRMPGSDGFFLVREIRKIIPWVQFIMITAHADRDYMKQAIQLGVCDFLFKPARVEDIQAAVRKACMNVEMYQDKRKKDRDYKNFILEHIDLLRKNLFCEFLEGIIDEEKMRKDACQLSIDLCGPYYKLLLIKIKHENIDVSIQQIAIEFEMFHATIIQIKSSPVYMAVLLNMQENQNLDIKSVVSGDEEIKIEWSSLRSPNLSEIVREYRNRLSSCGEQQEINKQSEDIKSKLAKIEETIYEAIRYHDSEEEIIRLFELYLKTAKDYKISEKQLNESGLSIIKTIRVLTGISRKEEYHGSEENIWQIRKLFFSLCREIKERQVYPLDDISRKALYFIKKRYTEDLMIEQIAAELFMSSSYLGRVIKERTGHGFYYWLNYYRIESAKDKLKTTEKNVEQIAEECGYNSYRIFSENFKKYTGKTATSWRKE